MSFHLFRNGNHSTIRHAIGRAHILTVCLLSGDIKEWSCQHRFGILNLHFIRSVMWYSESDKILLQYIFLKYLLFICRKKLAVTRQCSFFYSCLHTFHVNMHQKNTELQNFSDIHGLISKTCPSVVWLILFAQCLFSLIPTLPTGWCITRFSLFSVLLCSRKVKNIIIS